MKWKNNLLKPNIDGLRILHILIISYTSIGIHIFPSFYKSTTNAGYARLNVFVLV